jgi:hypothetical protein
MLRRILVIVLLCLAACIDPLDADLNTQREHLVVEGIFTNEAMLNYVRLSYSQPHTSPYNKFEEKAAVTVVGSTGESFHFLYDKAGYYFAEQGEAARGTIGHSYTLQIAVGDKKYMSKPVKLLAPIPIDSIHFEVDTKTYAFRGDKEAKLYPGYNVLINYNDPPMEKNFLRWTFATTYEVQTQPWEYIHPFTGLPAPKDCCTQCFLEEKLEQFKVIDDRLTDGRQVLNQNVLFIPFEKYLGVKNKLTVYQHTITSEAYNFFRILEQQKGTTGTVFDPPPAEVKGNMYNENDGEERVIGFFDVSGVSVRRITINKEDIPVSFPPFSFPDDCQKLPGATREIPADW